MTETHWPPWERGRPPGRRRGPGRGKLTIEIALVTKKVGVTSASADEIPPTAEGGYVPRSRGGVSLADEAFDRLAVFQFDRPDAQRRWNGGDEGTEMLRRHLPDLDLDAHAIFGDTH